MISTLSKATSTVAQGSGGLLRTTPRRMVASLIACLLASVAVGVATFTAYSSIQSTMQTIGKDAAPSIVAAERIQALLADADASGMNAVLTNDTPTGPSWTQYRSDMNNAQDQLITASQNITYGSAERVPILTMEQKLGEYEYTMGQIQGQAGGNAVASLDSANHIFQQYIRPASGALDAANYAHLTQKYTAHRNAIGWEIAIVWLFMLLLIAVLGGVQYLLFRRMHRVVNRGFAVATVVALFLMVYSVTALNVAEARVVAAKQNSFDSINALWSARAVSYDMNADESLYLLHFKNPAALAQDEADYTHYAHQMTSIDPQQVLSYAQSGRPFGGYLGVEMSNITYPGERQAALDAVKAWALYTHIDGQMRQLLAQDQYQQTLTIDLGTQPGQSDWAFAQFDSAMGRVIEINQNYFNQQVDDAFAILRPFPYVLFGALIAIIGAGVVGMKPRLDEYAF